MTTRLSDPLVQREKLATKSFGCARKLDTPRGPGENFSSCGDIGFKSDDLRKQSIHRKPTWVISEDQVSNVLAALTHADHLRLLPNRHITIDWQKGGVNDSIVATGRLLKLMRDALRKRRKQSCHIWVREFGRIVGQHTHLLLHVPPEEMRWFNRSRRRWLKMCGLTWRKGVWKSCAIRGAHKSPTAQKSEKLHQINAFSVLRYMLKHTGLDGRKHISLPYAPPCRIDGKRVATSQNVGRAAREKCTECCENLARLPASC